MAEDDRLPLEEGLFDQTGGLSLPYLLYLFFPLLLLALILSLFYRFFPFSWVRWLSALITVLAADVLLAMVLAQVLKARAKVSFIVVAIAVLWLLVVGISLRSPLRELFYLNGVFIAAAAFFLGLFAVGGFLLPFPPPEPGTTRSQRWRQSFRNHWTAFKILVDYLTGDGYPYWVITDEPREEDKIEKRGKGDALAMFALGNGIILSDCDHAVAVSDGMKFKGVQGPGLILTGFAERPMRTLDLRPQLRAFTVQGLTQDGIQVKVLAFTPFQIHRGEQQPQLGQPFPYRKSAAFQAVHAQMMNLPEGQGHPQHAWDELPQVFGTRILQDLLSQYRFNELYEYEPGQELPRARVAREFRDRLKAELEPLGIQLIGGGISNLLPVRDEVLKERVRSWQSEWVRRTLVQEAQGQRERLWRIEQARAEARANLILALGERLAELDRPDSPVSPETVIHQFLRILQEMVQQPMLRRYLPRETSEELRRLGGDTA